MKKPTKEEKLQALATGAQLLRGLGKAKNSRSYKRLASVLAYLYDKEEAR